MANRSDGGLGMVGSSGCGSTRSHSTSSGQAPSAGSGQVLRGRRDVVRLGPPKTAGRLTMNGRGWGTEGGGRSLSARLGMCSLGRGNVFSFLPNVSSFRPNVSRFRANVSQFLAECVQFRGGCVHFGGRCVQFSAGRPGWGWGADGRRDSSAPLRCAWNDNSGGGRIGAGDGRCWRWRHCRKCNQWMRCWQCGQRWQGWGRGGGQAVAQPSERTSACSSTVWVACSCLSGG